MKKVLVTGAGGFIGSHLTELLVSKGYSVRAFFRYNSRNNWGNLENSYILKDLEIVTGDIRDFDSVKAAMNGCSMVFHLAALIGIPFSYISPKAYLETNINGTYNVLQAGRELNIGQVIVTSTSETYGTAQYVPIDENHPNVGQSPYSASKISADQLSVSYCRSFDLPVKIVRPFNTYGPRQSARAIIPTIISQILSGKEFLTLGNLMPTRDLTFVKDTCQGFIEICNAENLVGEVINIGMGKEISIGNLVQKIKELLDSNIKIKVDDERVRPESSEVERLFCDNRKLINNTKWSPEYDLENGLIETIEWIKRNQNHFKPGLYNV